MMQLLRKILALALLSCIAHGLMTHKKAIVRRKDALPRTAAESLLNLATTIECFNYCTRQNSCQSFAFNGSQCNIFNQLFSDDEMMNSINWKFYEVHQESNKRMDPTHSSSIIDTPPTTNALQETATSTDITTTLQNSAVSTTAPASATTIGTTALRTSAASTTMKATTSTTAFPATSITSSIHTSTRTATKQPLDTVNANSGPSSTLNAIVGPTGDEGLQVAKDKCKDTPKNSNKKLVTIKDASKQKKIEEFIKSRGFKKNVWIGHSLNVNNKDKYTLNWPDNTVCEKGSATFNCYTNWKDGEPKLQYETGLQIIVDKGSDFGKWKTANTWETYPYICE